MKRKSADNSESDSEGSENLDLESVNDELPEEEFTDESDGEGRALSVKANSSEFENDGEHSVVSVDSKQYPADLNEDQDENMSVVSADDESDRDSVSLNSMDTIEVENAAKLKKEEAEALRNREFSQLYLPIGGIFDHALLQGLAIDKEAYKQEQQAFFNGDTVAERTTTRNTPVNVIEALDRELRFSRPSVTVDILVARYNVIRLVIKRRIDHLRAHGHSTPGIRFDSSSYAEEAPTESTRIVRSSLNDRLAHDIQFRDPPVTVKEMSVLHRMSAPAVHAKIYNMRNRGIVTAGIIASTGGRGRPRKSTDYPDTDAYTPHSAADRAATTRYTPGSVTIDKNNRVLKYFNAEEDTTLVNFILHNIAHNLRMDWNALDAMLSRSRGAAKQRWLKSLERKAGPEILSSLSKRLFHLYKLCSRSVSGTNSDNVDTNVDTGEREEVQCVLRDMVAGVQAFSDTFPHSTLTTTPHTLFSLQSNSNSHNTTTTQTITDTAYPTITTERSGRTITPTIYARESLEAKEIYGGAATQGTRKAFSEADDVLIISTVLENRRLGVERFWGRLDARLGRHTMASKGRWQRVLEPIVSERIAASGGSSLSSYGGGKNDSIGVPANTALPNHRLFAGFSTVSTVGSTPVVKTEDVGDSDPQSVEKSVLESIVLKIIESAATPTSPTKPQSTEHITLPNKSPLKSPTKATPPGAFTAEEDALILRRVAQWEQEQGSEGGAESAHGSGEFKWTELDVELRKPPYSALVRYRTALSTPVPDPAARPVYSYAGGGERNNTARSADAGSSDRRAYYRAYNKTKKTGGAEGHGVVPPQERMAVYEALWTRSLQQSTSLAAEAKAEDVVRTAVEHIVTIATSSAPTAKRNYNVKGLKRPSTTYNFTDVNNATSTDPDNTTTATNTTNNDEQPTNHRLRRFTPEEDAFVAETIRQCKESGKPVSWSGLDKALGRSTGAVRQRWKKVLNNEY